MCHDMTLIPAHPHFPENINKKMTKDLSQCWKRKALISSPVFTCPEFITSLLSLFGFDSQVQFQKIQQLRSSQTRAPYYGGSLPNVNQIGNASTEFQVGYLSQNTQHHHELLPIYEASSQSFTASLTNKFQVLFVFFTCNVEHCVSTSLKFFKVCSAQL